MKIPISWQDYHSACDELAAQLVRHISPDTIILIVPRGGLVAATLIAYKLKLRNLAIITKTGRLKRRDLLVVDDICDTGQTFSALRRRFPNALLVAPYVKPQGQALCSYWGKTLPQDDWAIFPYALDDVVNR